MQNTQHILMIRPVHFGFNPETAENNSFQQPGNDTGAQDKALEEFNALAALLNTNHIDVTVVNDSPEPHTPDSIFPNNWISFHEDGHAFLYPMFASNRRKERKPAVLDVLKEKFIIKTKTDLSHYEKDGLFLEGTGSMVLDRDHKIAYACLSPRTNKKVLDEFCRQTGYSAVPFTAIDDKGEEIYHTNVMMCVADAYVVICLESINNADEKAVVERSINETGKKIIPITRNQMNQFAGNMLQLENSYGEKVLVMSTQAYQSLNREQLLQLTHYNKIIHSPLNTIETNGGGSARCMIAEIFLFKK